MPTKKKATKSKQRAKADGNTFTVVALGGLDVPHLGRARAGKLTQEQFSDLAKLQLNNRQYAVKAELSEKEYKALTGAE